MFVSLEVCHAQIGRALSPDGDLNVNSFDNDADGNGLPQNDAELDPDGINERFTDSRDMFGPGARFADDPSADNYPFNLMDDSLSVFPDDTLGIIKGGDVNGGVPADSDPFFGVIDLNNPDTGDLDPAADPPDPPGLEAAEWVFDVSSSTTALKVSIDMAAMGDFEDGANDSFPSFQDRYDFFYAIDGGSFSPLFTSSIDTTIDDHPYTMEDGTVVLLNDPALIDGVLLNNEFQTFMTNVGTASSTLTLRFESWTDGGSEAFAFRNILIEEDAAVVVGDYDGDGFVTAADYTVFEDTFGSQNDLRADGNNNMVIDPGDLTIWKDAMANLGSGSGLDGAANVPEPSAMLLLAFGLLSLSAAVRRR